MAMDINNDNVQINKISKHAVEANSLSQIQQEVAAQAGGAPPLEEELINSLTLPPGSMPGDRFVQSEADRDAVHQYFECDESGWGSSSDAQILKNQIMNGLAPVPAAVDLPSSHIVKTEADRDAVVQHFAKDNSGWTSSADARILLNQILNGLAPAPSEIQLTCAQIDVRR